MHANCRVKNAKCMEGRLTYPQISPYSSISSLLAYARHRTEPQTEGEQAQGCARTNKIVTSSPIAGGQVYFCSKNLERFVFLTGMLN